VPEQQFQMRPRGLSRIVPPGQILLPVVFGGESNMQQTAKFLTFTGNL
jgi:hypothetical protein